MENPGTFRRPIEVGLAVAFLLLPSLLLLWPFTIEDAFITFRYSQHLAEGLGPVYNPGEYVEGYTAPLWMLLMVIPHALGLKVELFAAIVGIMCHAGTAWVWRRLLGAAGAAKGLALAFGLAVLLQPTLLAFSYSGMETSLNIFLLSLASHHAFQISGRAYQWRSWVELGLLLFLCLFSRPDSVVFCFALLLTAVWELRGGRMGQSRQKLGTALVVLGILLIGYLGWKLYFYGDLLPNTFYAKGSASLKQGIWYLLLFGTSTALPLAWLLGSWGWVLRKSLDRPLRLLAFIFPPLWMLYVLKIGGDFMEFRMMVPAIPFMLYAAVDGLPLLTKGKIRGLPAAVVLCLLGLGLWFAFTFHYPKKFVVAVPLLHAETGHPDHGNIVVGKRLRAVFGEDESLRLASGGAGALPYYAGYYLLDMVGLTDAEVARLGKVQDGIPGHQRFAGLDVLQRRSIHLVLGTWYTQETSQTSWKRDEPQVRDLLGLPGLAPDGIRVVAMPLGNGWEERMAYLRVHPAVERALAQGKLRELRGPL